VTRSGAVALQELRASAVQDETTDQGYPLVLAAMESAAVLDSSACAAKVGAGRYSVVRVGVAGQPYEKYNLPFVFPKNPGSIPAYGAPNWHCRITERREVNALPRPHPQAGTSGELPVHDY